MSPAFFHTIKSIIKSASPSKLTVRSSINMSEDNASHSPNIAGDDSVSAISDSSTLSIPPYISDILATSTLPQFSALPHIIILTIMGDGAFSNVYRAYDEKLGKEVAVKVVDKSHLNSSQKNFIHKEVAILRACKHPNIVKLYELVENRQNFFIIMELVSGGELFNKIIQHTFFSEHLARHIINQVASGIGYLHMEQGVVHRDIKPENILFEPIPLITDPKPYIDQGLVVHEGRDGEGYIVEGVGGAGIGLIKIADFGLSKRVLDSSTMTPCGTVGYTAPEIVKDQKYSYSVDMWALGCVLYTLLCGFPPFYDEDIHVLTEKVARGYFEFLSPWWDDISSEAKSLVSKLLAVNPLRRLTAERFFSDRWTNPSPSIETHMKPSRINPLATPITPSVTLKEAFDVSYAVQILQDDESRRVLSPGRIPRSIGKKKHEVGDFNLDVTRDDADEQRCNFSRGVYKEDELNFNLNLAKSTIIGKRQVRITPSATPTVKVDASC